MLKRAALMLLVVPVQMFNFSLARNFLHSLHTHSNEVVAETVFIDGEMPCVPDHTRMVVEQNRVLHFGPDGQVRGESTISDEGSEEIANDPAEKVDVEESACNEEGCENP